MITSSGPTVIRPTGTRTNAAGLGPARECAPLRCAGHWWRGRRASAIAKPRLRPKRAANRIVEGPDVDRGRRELIPSLSRGGSLTRLLLARGGSSGSGGHDRQAKCARSLRLAQIERQEAHPGRGDSLRGREMEGIERSHASRLRDRGR